MDVFKAGSGAVHPTCINNQVEELAAEQKECAGGNQAPPVDLELNLANSALSYSNSEVHLKL